MSQYAYAVIRWPFNITGADLSWTVRNTTNGVDNTQAISAGIYICDGSAAAIAPIDLIKRLQTAIAAALTAESIAGTITVSLRTDGRVEFAYAGLSKNIALKNLTANQIAYIGVGASQITGGLFAIGVASSTGTITTSYQAGSQWHPMIDQDRDSADVRKRIVYGDVNLLGKERRVVRSVGSWRRRTLSWIQVAAGVMTDARADDADYAAYAGITTGEDNTWEAMWDYLLGPLGPYGDQRIYLYTSNVVADATRQGPYDYLLGQSMPGIDGIDPDDYVRDQSSEHYPVKIVLRSI